MDDNDDDDDDDDDAYRRRSGSQLMPLQQSMADCIYIIEGNDSSSLKK